MLQAILGFFGKNKETEMSTFIDVLIALVVLCAGGIVGAALLGAFR